MKTKAKKFCKFCGGKPCLKTCKKADIGAQHSHCEECGDLLILTSRTYFACPHGHGRLVPNPAATRKDVEDDLREFAARPNIPEKQKVVCAQCKDTKVCQNCDGEGETDCPECGSEIDCIDCHGDGKCHWCKGSK